MERLDLLPEAVLDLADRCARADGHPPFSKRKLATVRGIASGRAASWGDGDSVEVAAVAVQHRIGPTDEHWAVEVAVDPQRRAGREDEALELALGIVRDAACDTTLWCFRPGQIEAARRLGFEIFREVILMEAALPAPQPPVRHDYRIRRFQPGDEHLIARLNNEAFRGHRENAAMTPEAVEELGGGHESVPSGVLIVERAEDGDPAGFCWTTTPRRGVGEIFLIGLTPKHQGRGLGVLLLRSALKVLFEERGAASCELWTDGDNDTALALYRDHGFATRLVNREMRRARRDTLTDQPKG